MAERPKYVQYTALRVRCDEFKSYTFDGKQTMAGLSQLNILVGPNNSGKSRLLRILCRKDVEYDTNQYSLKDYIGLLEKYKATFYGCFDASVVKVTNYNGGGELTRTTIENLIGNMSKSDVFHGENTPCSQITELVKAMRQSDGHPQFHIGRAISIPKGTISAKLKACAANIEDDLNQCLHPDKTLSGEQRVYVPMLRGLRPFRVEEQDASAKPHVNYYYNRTKLDYFKDKGMDVDPYSRLDRGDKSASLRIVTGLEMFTMLRAMLLGEPDDRRRVRAFEDFLKERFFKGREVTLIPKEGDDVVHIKIGDDPQFAVHQLGDGLQTLLIVLFPVFMASARTLFFIEEPELGMHPGLQRALLTAMTDFGQHQYFIATHSNHMLDMTMDFSNVSVFFCRKVGEGTEAKFEVQTVSSPNRNILQELGVRTSSVFLTNATIWVEGITDRLYLREMMRRYQKESDDDRVKALKEDVHYAFVEYQGANLVHWTFEDDKDTEERIKVLRMCGHAFVIADGDVVSKGDRAKVYEKELKDRFYVLGCKEIENLLPVEVVRAIAGTKSSEVREKPEILQYSEYSVSSESLGAYIDGRTGHAEQFEAEKGGLKDKVEFCRKVVAWMGEHENEWKLTGPIRSLCEKVVMHIVKQNGM